MEYITSRGFDLPKTKSEMEKADWFNMWHGKQFPYRDLMKGDILYWYDKKEGALIWRTLITDVEREPYTDKEKIFKRFQNSLGTEYHKGRATKGYCLRYKFKVLERVSISKPKNYSIPQLGWIKLDNKQSQRWFKRDALDDNTTIEANYKLDYRNMGTLLLDLNEKMKDVSPERIKRLIYATFRKDSKIVDELKRVANYACQFPGCGHKIQKKSGGFYIEVAHIEAVAKGGKSVLGNLLVLCPNHHKAFDHGKLQIIKQTPVSLAGKLNNQEFQIKLFDR